MRADSFCDLICIDHADVTIRSETYTVFVLVDGATTFVTAFAPRTKDSHDTVQCLMEWMDTFHCTPLSVCADMAFQSSEVQDLFRRLNIRPFFYIGPYTPWPNRAEAAVRVFKENLHDLCSQIGSAPELEQVAVRELLRNTATMRNSMVTYGGKEAC